MRRDSAASTEALAERLTTPGRGADIKGSGADSG